MKKGMESFLHWLPKVITILFCIFLAIFSLDIFGENLGFWGTVLGLFMHNIPVFLLVLVLILAWRRPIVGTLGFLLLDLLYIFSMWHRQSIMSSIYYNPVFLGGILISVLFWISHKRNKYYWANRNKQVM